jgi:hypothetical protein
MPRLHLCRRVFDSYELSERRPLRRNRLGMSCTPSVDRFHERNDKPDEDDQSAKSPRLRQGVPPCGWRLLRRPGRSFGLIVITWLFQSDRLQLVKARMATRSPFANATGL